MSYSKEEKKVIRGTYNVFFNNKIFYNLIYENKKIALLKGAEHFGTKHVLKRHFYSFKNESVLSHEEIALFANNFQESSYTKSEKNGKRIFDNKRLFSSLRIVLSSTNSLITYYSNRKNRPLDNKRLLFKKNLHVKNILEFKARVRAIAKSSSHFDEFDLRVGFLCRANSITNEELKNNLVIYDYEPQGLKDFFEKINENNTFYNASHKDVRAIEVAKQYTELYLDKYSKNTEVNVRAKFLKKSLVRANSSYEKNIMRELSDIGLLKEVDNNVYLLHSKYTYFFLENIKSTFFELKEEFQKNYKDIRVENEEMLSTICVSNNDESRLHEASQ